VRFYKLFMYTTKRSIEFFSLSNYCQISLPYSVPSFLVGFYAKVDLPCFGTQSQILNNTLKKGDLPLKYQELHSTV
jgi:hypothetical protein